MEFWNELITKASWEKLQQLTKEIDFVLIGGWAAYLWTKKHKSKDIDILVDYETLAELQRNYRVEKNDRLRKYEIKLEKFDMDIYLPHYSKLTIAPEDLIAECTTKIEGMKTISGEALLVLKQGAEIDRRNSTKGKKDVIDIITLLIYAPIDLKKYEEILKKYKLERFVDELTHTIKNFDEKEIAHLYLDFNEFSKWKKRILEELKKI